MVQKMVQKNGPVHILPYACWACMLGAFHDWEDQFLHKFLSTDIPVRGSFNVRISLPTYFKFPNPGL